MGNLPAVLRTERLLLCPLEEAHRERVTALLIHPAVGKTYMVPDFSSQEEANALFDRLKALSEGGERVLYAICRDGQAVGLIHDVGMDEAGVEVGYAIHPDSWGLHIASEALSAVTEALLTAGFACVRAAAFEGNAASLRVMEKSGMVPTGEEEWVEYRGVSRRCLCMAKKRP